MSRNENSFRWLCLTASERGNTHVLRNKPNQDAFYCRHLRRGKDGLILVLADGHGGERYVRSQTGAELAVKVTEEYLKTRIQALANGNRRFSRSELEDEIGISLVRMWRKRVQEHADKFGWTEEEQKQGWGLDSKQSVFSAYGATLLFVAALPHFIIYGQIGDGDILIVSALGAVSRPIERSASSFANETLSLCSTNAEAELRVSMQNYDREPVDGDHGPPGLILLATDGYANSFSTDKDFVKVASDIYAYLKADDGHSQVKTALPHWLKHCATTGSGDDVTVGLLFPSTTIRSRVKEEDVNV